MHERLKIFKMLMPAEFVQFDHNPERMRVQRRQAGSGRSHGSSSKNAGRPKATGGQAGTIGPTFQGTDPLEVSISKAHLIGRECKPMCDTLLDWLSPVSGLPGAAGSALGISPPDLVVQWGPPGAGFMITAVLAKVDITYQRVSSTGILVHAMVDLTLKERLIPLSLTNPTSGGRPGRNRYVVSSDETLMSIATKMFGTPSAWRAIAEVNQIDDPGAIEPGDVVYLPAPDELAEMARAAR